MSRFRSLVRGVSKMNAETAQIKQPTLLELAGEGIQITYSTTSFAGKPQFYYQDAGLSKLFVGDQIQVVDTDLGKLVSVVILLSIDTGSTSFTLLVPRVSLRLSDVVNIATVGITALHKKPVVGPSHGQTDFYTVHP